MLTNEQLASLEIGDQLDLPGLFLGLTDEPVVLLVTEVGSSERTVEGRYFGVLLGYWTAFEQGGSVGWRYRKPSVGGQGDWLAPGMEA